MAEPTTFAIAASPSQCTSSSSSAEISSRYHDNAGAASPPPAAQGIESTLTRPGTVRGICNKFSIPADYKPSCAGGLGRACNAPPHLKDCICVYEAALEAGMRIPLHPFYSKLLRHYNLAPSQLTPNSWRYMAAFVVLCSDAGLKPRLSVFRHFFTVCLYTHNNRDGWHIIKPQMVSEQDRRCRLFSTSNWQLPKNDDGWKERFFFLSSPTGTWPCPIKWGKHTSGAADDLKLSVKAKEDIQKLYNMQVSTCIDLMSLLADNKLAAALSQVTPVKKVVNSGAKVAMVGPTTPEVKSPTHVASPVTFTPPGGSITRDQVPVSALNTDCDGWLKTVLSKTADVAIEEYSLLRRQLSEATKSEEAAKTQLLNLKMEYKSDLDNARKSEAAAKSELEKLKMAYESDLDNARKSEAAAKSELDAVRGKLTAARAEIDKARKSEAAAKAKFEKERKSKEAVTAQFNKAKKSEAAAKDEIAVVNAKLEEIRKSEVATKEELDEIKKSQVSTKAMLAAAKVNVRNTGNGYFEDFKRLHNLMMNDLESAFGKSA